MPFDSEGPLTREQLDAERGIYDHFPRWLKAIRHINSPAFRVHTGPRMNQKAQGFIACAILAVAVIGAGTSISNAQATARIGAEQKKARDEEIQREHRENLRKKAQDELNFAILDMIEDKPVSKGNQAALIDAIRKAAGRE